MKRKVFIFTFLILSTTSSFSQDPDWFNGSGRRPPGMGAFDHDCVVDGQSIVVDSDLSKEEACANYVYFKQLLEAAHTAPVNKIRAPVYEYTGKKDFAASEEFIAETELAVEP